VTEVAARPGKVRTRKAAPAREATAHMATTEATAHMPTTEATSHMTAAAEPAAVSTATATVSTATAARKRVSGQSPGESGRHSHNNHGFAYH
jgi:hypothetical protein